MKKRKLSYTWNLKEDLQNYAMAKKEKSNDDLSKYVAIDCEFIIINNEHRVG